MRPQRVKSDDLKPGPIRHEQLPPALIARIEALRSTLEEVYPQSMTEWLDGFQRDANPESEVQWWERLAQCYVDYKSRNQLSAAYKQTAFNVILKLALGATHAKLAGDFSNLPFGALDEIRAIMRSATP